MATADFRFGTSDAEWNGGNAWTKP